MLSKSRRKELVICFEFRVPRAEGNMVRFCCAEYSFDFLRAKKTTKTFPLSSCCHFSHHQPAHTKKMGALGSCASNMEQKRKEGSKELQGLPDSPTLLPLLYSSSFSFPHNTFVARFLPPPQRALFSSLLYHLSHVRVTHTDSSSCGFCYCAVKFRQDESDGQNGVEQVRSRLLFFGSFSLSSSPPVR